MDEDGFVGLQSARVTIAGLGLMGGSLALALRGRCREVVGVDTDPATTALALDRGAVDRVAAFEAAATDTDLLVLAAPVRGILALLAQLTHCTPPRPTVVLDLGSTKSDIVAAMQTLPAGWDPVGGHPMCGKEVSGLAHAEAALFRGKLFVLSPLERSSAWAVALAEEVVAAVEARPLRLEARHHDALAASSSHLPYLIASLLVRTAESANDEAVWEMAASGFRDTSRLAASDVRMMLDILLTNRTEVLAALERYQAELETLTGLLEAGEAEALKAYLGAARERRSLPLWAKK
jgi:prephenate dehydrogenase